MFLNALCHVFEVTICFLSSIQCALCSYRVKYGNKTITPWINALRASTPQLITPGEVIIIVIFIISLFSV